MTVATITFVEEARGPWTDLPSTVTIREVDEQGNLGVPVEGAAVTGLLFRDGVQFNALSGTTDTNGQVTWTLQGAAVGSEYCLRVDSVSHSHTYDATLSPEYDPIVGKPQACHTVVGA